MRLLPTFAAAPIVLLSASAYAADPPDPTGAPPPDAAALVVPTKVADAPKIEKPKDATNATLSAGGLYTTGNSRLLALTVNGTLELRRGDNGFGASVLGNYGEGAPAGQGIQVTAENIQGRVRYDRYISDRASFFLIDTERHDRFQGLDLRTNVDPGFKYLFVHEKASTVWGEVGYDFQYDIRRDEARVQLDANGNPAVDASGNRLPLLQKTEDDHSSRLFFGARHAFNKEVTLALGAEYLQSFLASTKYRMNFDALFAAKVGGGLSVGFGFSARFDHDPLPGKEQLDTTTTVSLIYAFSDVKEPPKPKTCPCPPEPPPPPHATPDVPPPPAPNPTPPPAPEPAPIPAPEPPRVPPPPP